MPCEWCTEILWPAVARFLVPGVALIIATLVFAFMSYVTTTVSPTIGQSYAGCCGLGGAKGQPGLLIADSACGIIWLLILVLFAVTAPQRWSASDKRWFAGAISVCAVFFFLMAQSVLSIQYYRLKHPLQLRLSPTALARAICWTVICRHCRNLCQVPISCPDFPCPSCGHAFGLQLPINPHVVAVGQPVYGQPARPRITTATLGSPHNNHARTERRHGDGEGVDANTPDAPVATEDSRQLFCVEEELFRR